MSGPSVLEPIRRDLFAAFYLASSWLWCIGAFFPLILIRDYGGVSLVAFTLFNIAGALWFGFHFTRGADAAFRQRQGAALLLFSAVTIAYQVFFVVWLGAVLRQPWLILAMLALTVVFYRAGRRLAPISVAIFLVCMGLFWLYALEGLDLPLLAEGRHWPHVLLPLAFGFVLSPYLDLTFHRAYQESAHPRFSFSFGFGVLFLALLLFVFAYAGDLAKLFFGGETEPAVLYPVIAFILIQTAFTAAAHAREAGALAVSRTRIPSPLLLTAVAAALSVVYLGHGWRLSVLEQTLGEAVYKSFLFFYGLVFPLQVLYDGRRQVFWGLLLVTAPLYTLGFLIGDDLTFALSVAMGLIAVTVIAVPLVFTQRTV